VTTACAIAWIWSGVVPQPANDVDQTFSRKLVQQAAVVTSGFHQKRLSLIGLGRPALGWQLMKVSGAALASS
jgi:hypothetical protein